MFANALQLEPSSVRLAACREAHWGMPIRVLSVGDDPLVHEGIRALLGAENDMELVGRLAGDRLDEAKCGGGSLQLMQVVEDENRVVTE